MVLSGLKYEIKLAVIEYKELSNRYQLARQIFQQYPCLRNLRLLHNIENEKLQWELYLEKLTNRLYLLSSV